ncbi:uncharacterized protein LOC122058241 [Macadamia integrifolia]|uniref:uncharacterized protein LOC122058241 n=1 Tax=Macadamia integrifolia TaxID=60698 RepID=UPI001C531800|nr:uncharacterized protein LOC122058241 [Macadamia integrifolia]XP_042476771.1 uncharacterized protein LOC122058241 [Macadamia integrifolia]XP_042476772.1 uncharacterized protein LOC122058241 [Macadamia integrifolia]XP_042476773.1 uncharacterized protein LOC122058241 [Macadamia integrifolia]
MESLEVLIVQSCHKVTELPDLSNLKILMELKIEDCANLGEIHSIKGSESLEVLRVKGCHKLTELPDLSNLKRLMELNIGDCANLEEIHSIKGSESLEVLRVKGCHKLTELPDMSNLKRLMELNIGDCANLEEIHSIKGSESLKELTVKGCHKLRELPDMSNLKGLVSLYIINCVNLQKIHRFEGAESLQYLGVLDCYKLTETTRKILGQGRLLVDNVGKGFGQGTNSIGTDDHHVYPGSPFLCIVLAFTSGSGDRSERVKFVVGELVTITLQISAFICWGEKDTMFVYSIRIEDIEFTERDIIYIHHFKVLDWFPLESKPAIKEFRGDTLKIFRQSDSHHYSYDQINVCVKHWKVLFEDIESEQQMPNQQSSAMLVADFFRWDEEEGADKEVEEEQDANNDDEQVEDKEDADNDEEDKKAGGSGVCNCFVAVKAVWDGFCNCFSRGFWRYVTGAS